MVSGFEGTVQQMALIDTLALLLPLVISIGVISGATYLLLGRSETVEQRENSQIIRIIGALFPGIVLGFPFTQAVLMSPAYQQLMASIL